MNKHIKGIVCAVVMALTFAQIGGNAFAAQLSTNDLNLSKSEIAKLTNEGKLNDQNFINGILEARKTKTELSKIKENNKKLGITEFWNSVIPEELEQYYINDDGTVTLRDSNNLTTNALKSDASSKNTKTKLDKAKQFEEKLKELVSKVEEKNNKSGINKKVLHTDGEGRITNVGDFSGETGYNNVCDLTKAKKGDVFLGDMPGSNLYGDIDHAGIFNGNAYSDNCIFSNANPNTTAGYDKISGWDKAYNSIYDMNVWTTDMDQADSAFRMAYSTFKGKPYRLTGKLVTSSTYCSKIPWYGYLVAVNVDIDGFANVASGDGLVTPDAIYASDNTSVRNHWTD